MANVTEVTGANWESEVLKAEEPVLVDFWAPWCGPCKAIAPAIDQLAGDLAGKLKVVKVNTDEASDIASQYGIMQIPTLLLFKGGQVADQIPPGTKAGMQSRLEKHVA